MSNTFRPSAPTRHTVVEEGTEFKGTLKSSCPIDVRGRIEGEIATPSLTVSTSGAVHGRAKVGSVRSEGELSGEFDAESIELAGAVCDNTVIRARTLEVKLSSRKGKLQVIFGECELAVGDEPRERAEVAPVQVMPEAQAAMPALEQPAMEEGLLESQLPPAGADEASADGAEEEEDETAEAAEAPEAAEAGGKKKKKRKNGHAEEEGKRWSHPPSQPPPAS